MNMNKIAMKITILLILSLTLTAGYAQALPDLSSFGYGSKISTSYYDLIASKLSGIYGNSHTEFDLSIMKYRVPKPSTSPRASGLESSDKSYQDPT